MRVEDLSMAWLRTCAIVLALSLIPGVSNARQDETPRDTEAAAADVAGEPPTAGEATPAQGETAAGVEGPLYVVTREEDTAEEVREIYREGDLAFLNFFWWWIVLIAGLTAIGAGAYWIWGRRKPRRASRL